MKRKNILGVLICLTLLACALCGCAQSARESRQGTAEHEVLTLTEVPEDKLMITMRLGDGMDYERMEEAIEARFPDVDIVVRSNTAEAQAVSHCDIEDIFLMGDGKYPADELAASMMDLSSEAYVQNYYLSALQQSEIEGRLYYLPGPSNIYGIVYNKDMFREHGWTPPENLDEFLALCGEIERSGIRALQPALYYKDANRQLFTGFTYQAVLGGVENEKWLSDYKTGASVMKGHMEPAFDIMDRLIEAGALRPGDFSVQPRERSNMMYAEQSCAMILETQAAVSYAEKTAGDDAPELGLLPFFSGPDRDSDYFLSVPVYNMAASKRLEEPGNEKKLAAVREIFAYLSTAEGQEAVIGENASVISSVKGLRYGENAFLQDAEGTIEKGHVVPQPLFVGTSNTEVDQVLWDDMSLYTDGQIDRERFMADMDQARDQVLQSERATQAATIGTAEETFSVLQTSCLLAEIFQEKAEAQIGLCPANTRVFGNNWKIYQGDIQFGRIDTLDRFLGISFQFKPDEHSTEGGLIRAGMTGESILKALNTIYGASDVFSDAYMAASGLQITFAPWAGQGNRYISVKLADGTELDPTGYYTVAFWNGAVDPALIETVEEEYGDTAPELFQQWVEDHGGSIKPGDSGFTLDWETTQRKAG